MTKRAQRIGSLLILGTLALCLCLSVGLAIAGDARPQRAAQTATGGLVFVDMALLAGLVSVAVGSIRLAEAAVKKLRGQGSGAPIEQGLTPKLAQDLEQLCGLHRVTTPDGRPAVFASPYCGEQHNRIVDLLEKQRDREEAQMQALSKLCGAVTALNESVANLRQYGEVLSQLARRQS